MSRLTQQEPIPSLSHLQIDMHKDLISYLSYASFQIVLYFFIKNSFTPSLLRRSPKAFYQVYLHWVLGMQKRLLRNENKLNQNHIIMLFVK